MEHKSLVNTLAKKLNRDNKDVTALIEGLSATLREKLSDNNIIAIPGFGEFEPVKEDEYIQDDLSTGKRMLFPPCISLKFNPSSILKRKFTDRP
jgi:nucleoid DNA-binding protein